jgi:HSP20 family protein
MALIRWEPARDLYSVQQEVNRLFGTFFDSQAGGNRQDQGARRRWIPAMDLAQDADSYVLRADLPGVREQDVKVELEDNVLTISGERHFQHEDRKQGYYRVERASGSFSRSLVLPEGVDPTQIRARIEHGVLEVSVPKPHQRAPHRVAIDVAGDVAHVDSAHAPEADDRGADDGAAAEGAPAADAATQTEDAPAAA